MMRRTTVAASLPALMMQVVLGAAVAQTKADAPPPPRRPIVTKVRPRTATTQPAREVNRRRPAGAGRKAPAARMSPEEQARAATQPSRLKNWSSDAQKAMNLRLSGADIQVTEAGSDGVIVQGTEEDLAIIESLLKMLDTTVPAKRVEYVRLKNAQAKDLAKTLQDVFSKIEKRGDRPVLPQDKVDIIADPRTNGLYIAATDEKMAQALKLIDDNERSTGPSRNVRSFEFKNRRVVEVGELLKRVAAIYLKQKGVSDMNQIAIEIDPLTNKVIVTAGEADLDFIAKTVESLDAEASEEAEEARAGGIGQADIMVVPLRIAKADTLATILNTLLERAATGDTPMKDFIRRFRLLDENGNPLATVNLDRPIFVFGEPDSNALIIASSLDNCLIMKQVALAFDKEPARMPVESRVFTLEYADATDVADKIDKMLADSESLTERPGKPDKGGVPEGEAGALVYKAVISADARTNQVVVIGRPEAVETLGGLIGKLDIKGRGVMPFDIVKLRYASATGLASALTEMMDKRKDALPDAGPNATKSETVIITPDPRSQSLIIAARRERMEELKELIVKLDIQATALIENIRAITLKNSNATELEQKLKDLWQQTKDQRGGESGGFELEVPAIVADERSNSLIVAASESDFEAIRSVVDKIENLPLNPMANIYIVRLKYNSASQLSSALQTLFEKRAEMRTVDGKTRPEDKVTIEADDVTNALLVAASRENYAVLLQKIAELDVEIGVPGSIAFFVCENVSAVRVKDVLDGMFEGDGLWRSTGTSGEAAKTRQRVTIAVDERSNALIVSASPENMEAIRAVYERMNSVTTPWDVANVEMITLQHADCVQVAAQLEQYFQDLDNQLDTGGSGSKRSALFAVKIISDKRSNRVIVGGTKDGIDRAVEMIKKLDVPAGEPNQVTEVYTLKEAPAQRVGEMITNIFQERNQPRQGEQDSPVPNIPVTVESDDATQTLVINASKQDHVLIKDLIVKLDRPTAMLTRVRAFPLHNARSDKVKEILDELYQSGDQGGAQTVSVVEDLRTNAIVVAAPPGELANIAGLVERLDAVEISDSVEVGIFLCENEDANKMSELLNEILTGRGGQGGGAGGAENENARDPKTMLIHFKMDEKGRKKLLQSYPGNVQITYNERTNSVVVMAPPDSLKLIKALINKLDRIEKREVLVKVFPLRHADATRMVDLLESMFAQDQGSDQERAFQQGREVTVEGGMSSTGGVPTAASQTGESRKGTFGRPRTTFVADERTNSLIAAGWPEDVDVVADIIDQLDSRDIQDRTNFVVRLVNMESADMQSALDSYFQAERQVFDTVADVSPQQRMEQEVSIIAHEQSNQLIVSTSPRYKSTVLRIIEQLDMPPPQVMIEVMIAEVTIDDRFEMGLEFALQELRFSETAIQGPNGVLQSSHFDVVGGTDLGAAGSGLGGFSFTISGEDFNFLVRALQTDSRLEVIQKPKIMCQDNQQANITVGQNVPFVRNTTVSDSGQVTANVEYEDVGIILDVEPIINPDGFVYLRVAPQISAITDSSVPIGNGIFAPIFTNRQAETTVAVKDGETVVIGGLITTSENESESKVPLLGDIPGLGALFRTTSRTKQQTELLIALTPTIVRTVEDARRMSIAQRDQSGIITDQMKQSVLFDELRVTPESQSEVESIETPPAIGAPGVEGAPEISPAGAEPQPEYGPKLPQYGPTVPAGDSVDDIVASRDVATRRINRPVGSLVGFAPARVVRDTDRPTRSVEAHHR
ncbi:MAG: secretin N-terminal domain-containing protein [Phycisphaerae bacterium]